MCAPRPGRSVTKPDRDADAMGLVSIQQRSTRHRVSPTVMTRVRHALRGFHRSAAPATRVGDAKTFPEIADKPFDSRPGSAAVPPGIGTARRVSRSGHRGVRGENADTTSMHDRGGREA